MRAKLALLARKYRIIMVEPLYPMNIGYVLRAMKNFGLRELYLVNPRVKLNHEVRAFSAHAYDLLNEVKVVKELEDALSNVNYLVGTTGKGGGRYNVNRIALSPEEFAENASRINGKVAIMLGREDRGLTNEELTLCNTIVRIPANPEYPILNVSHAAAIIFYEIFKKEIAPSPREVHEAPRVEEMEVLKEYVNEIVKELNYPPPKARIVHSIVRRVLGRAFVTRREVYAILGLLRKTLNKIKSP
ncbi:MAG: RNA methyltransferase [Thermofilum sp. ex4484_15]|nr:MAG: RNA methyltransferase [Thermofilum sp. ex4484_15]